MTTQDTGMGFSLYRYQLPLTKPLPLGQQRIHNREGLILHIDALQQSVEIAPLPSFSKESLDDCINSLQQLLSTVPMEALSPSSSQSSSQNLAQWMTPFKSAPNSVQFGLSLLWLKCNDLLPARPNRNRQPLLFGETEQLAQQLSQLPEETKIVKLKVGPDIHGSVANIYQVIEARPQLKLRLDANQSLSLEQAQVLYAMIPKANIDYVEEPCARVEDAQQLYQEYGIRYAQDESLLQTEDYQPHPGLAAVVLKPSLLGSIEVLEKFAEQAQAEGVEVVISSAFESSFGIHDLACLANHYAPLGYPGLDTLNHHQADLLQPSLYGSPESPAKPLLTLNELSLI